MARFSARRVVDENEGYIGAADGWPIEEAIYRTLSEPPFWGTWNGDTRQFRLRLDRLDEAVKMLHSLDHRVNVWEGDRGRPVLMECSECASPRKGALEGDPCPCGGVMRRPHVCDDACKTNAHRPGEAVTAVRNDDVVPRQGVA